MTELQAALEFQVELSKFYNVDLFQRGYYQIRAALKTAPRVPIKVEVSLPRNSESDLVFPASVINGVAVSKTFQILYRNEDVTINDVILFKVQMLVDANKVEESLASAEFHLGIDLWFTDEEMGPEHQEKLQCISERVIALHMTAATGLHHHLPLLFDYFHLCVVCVSIHASLIALHQPYMSIAGRPPARQAWARESTLDALYFGNASSRPSSSIGSTISSSSSSPRLTAGREVHKHICCILLSAYESLQCSLQSLMVKLPASQQLSIDYLDCRKKLNAIMERIQKFDSEEELLQTAQSDVATLCAENVILWHQYLEVVTLNDKITHQLAKEHHLQRVKRFAEAFFTAEYPKQTAIACFDPNLHGHSDIGAAVKSSAYFASLPTLAAECAEMDGDLLSTPIIFEDIFCEAQPVKQFSSEVVMRRDRTSSRGSDASSLSDSSSSSPKFKRSSKLKFIKNIKPETFKRPSSTFNNEQDVKGSVAGAREPDKCQLVGYRKRDSNTFAPIMELGTLSPATVGRTMSARDNISVASASSLHNAASLPTLVGEGGLSLVSSGSMPELNRANSFRRYDGKERPRHLASRNLEQQLQEDALQLKMKQESSDEEQQKNSTEEETKTETQEGKITQSGSIGSSNDTASLKSVNKEGDNSPSTKGSELDALSLQSKDSDSLKLQTADTDSVKSQPNESESPRQLTNDSNSDKTDTSKDAQSVHSEGSSKNDSPKEEADPVHPQSDSPVSQEGVEVAINGIELEPDLTNDEILLNLRDSTDGASTNSATDQFKELSVDNSASMDQQCTIFELLKDEFKNSGGMGSNASSSSSGKLGMARLEPVVTQPTRSEFSLLPQTGSPDRSHLLVSPVPDETINFITAKENLRRTLKYTGHIYSDFPSQSSTVPYFWPVDGEAGHEEDNGIHLVVCVHGLDGNSADLRLVRTYLEMALPGNRIDFLMSERNQPDTFADFEVMTERLIAEILAHIEIYGMSPKRISFVGHSLGNLIIRSALGHPKLAVLLPFLHTFLSLSGPHLGTLYNSSGLVNMGMWFMQKWKKSGSLLQLSLKDHSDPRQTFLYKLSQKPGLEFFKHILLVSSQQDRYVPYHSSRIELCKSAVKDTSGLGAVYAEMVSNLLQPVLYKSDVELVRYDVFHALPNTANSLIGRAAHIAVLDSEIFIEKFMTVAALKYFK